MTEYVWIIDQATTNPYADDPIDRYPLQRDINNALAAIARYGGTVVDVSLTNGGYVECAIALIRYQAADLIRESEVR